MYRTLIVCDLPKSVVYGCKVREALCLQQFFIVCTACRVNNMTRLLIVVKRPWNCTDEQLLIEHRHRAGRISRKINRTICDHLHALSCIAACKLIIRENVNDDIAAAFLLHHLRKTKSCLRICSDVRSINRHHQFDLLILSFFALTVSPAAAC